MPQMLQEPSTPAPAFSETPLHAAANVKDFLLTIMNERDRKYEQRFTAIEKTIWDTNQAVKDTLASANTNTKDALAQAYMAIQAALAAVNSNIQTMSFSIDKRFEAVNEFRAQLTAQADTFARKSDVDGVILALEKATGKAEAATEKRFDSVNEFRSQLSDQQRTLATKAEVEIRLEALDKRLDAAVVSLQTSVKAALEAIQLQRGQSLGANAVWGALGVGVAMLLGIASLLVKLR